MFLSLPPRLVSSALRSLSTATSPSPALTLYQYKICPFCCKTKSLLTHLGVPYSTVEVNPLTKAQFAAIKDVGDSEESRKYKKVPVAILDGARINGSGDIIDSILAKHGKTGSQFTSKGSNKWLDWCDNTLAVRIYPAITESFGASLNTFSYIDDVESFSAVDKLTAKYVGALAMVMAGGSIKKKYGITDVDASLREAVVEWVGEALSGGVKQFEGGSVPSIADVCVYGVIKGVEGTKGRFFEDIFMAEPLMAKWYGEMHEIVGELK
jgi:microsomal prostaglandin-E synthase 2